MKKLICMAMACMLLLSGCGIKSDAPAEASSDAPAADLLSGTWQAEITVKDYGTITLELDADTAPVTVTNFVGLARDGFYDGLTFHRIISGFMIQGGDPNGNGTGGSEHTIRGEFSDNGVENDIKHVRGVISMARSQSYDSASSQFFIMHEDAPHLDGQYAAFGHVTAGMEVVDAICESTPVQDSNGTVAPDNQPVIESIKILE
ncbi:MAG: peptidylprolyl isomerase [Butyricicoccus sp.]